VARHVPAFARVKVLEADGSLSDPNRPLMVRDLLTHTSGLPYPSLPDSKVSDMYADAKILKANVPLGEAVDDLARYPLAFQPGCRWQYSLGIDVAARIV